MVRALLRVGLTTAWTVFLVILSLGTLVGPQRLRRRLRWGQRWCRGLLRIWGVRVVEEGRLPDTSKPGVVVSNHLSYLDIILLASRLPVVFVAKAEIRRWPIIGLLGQYGGTVFIDRSNILAIKRQIGAMQKRAGAGVWIGFFPEGGISRSDEVRPFRRGLFALVHQTGLPVYPVVIRYQPLGAVHWASGEPLHQHAWRWLRDRSVTAYLNWLPPVRLDPNLSGGEIRRQIDALHTRMAAAYEALKGTNTLPYDRAPKPAPPMTS